jgi:transposase-like protein
LNYRYNAWKQGVKEQISELTLNSSGVRDISRILKISKNTVISEFFKKPEFQNAHQTLEQENHLLFQR